MATRRINIYAGIGSRDTPPEVCRIMVDIARQLADDDWMLRSGHARGADMAFELGALKLPHYREIHLPWDGYNGGHPKSDRTFIVPRPTEQICEIASRFHPRWDHLTSEVKLFMCRNVTIILGEDLCTPVQMVICWTPGARLTGGTAHAMKVADAYDIPLFNIADPRDQARLCEFTRTHQLA